MVDGVVDGIEMRKIIIFGVFALFFYSGVQAQELSRYQVSSSESKTVLVDTKTGESWILLPTKYQEGYASDKQYQWNKIGFAPGSAIKKKR